MVSQIDVLGTNGDMQCLSRANLEYFSDQILILFNYRRFYFLLLWLVFDLSPSFIPVLVTRFIMSWLQG